MESLLVKNQDFREGIFAAIGEFKQELILKLQDLKNKFAESNNERDIKARKSDSKLDELAFSVLSKGEAILKKVKILDRVLRAVERNSNRVDGKLDVIIEEGARLYGNIDESRKEIEMKLEGGFVSTLNK